MKPNIDETRTTEWIVKNIIEANMFGAKGMVINFADPNNGILSFHYINYVIHYEYKNGILIRTDTPMEEYGVI